MVDLLLRRHQLVVLLAAGARHSAHVPVELGVQHVLSLLVA